MATSATPNGAEPVGTLSGSGSFSGKMRHYPIADDYGTAIFYGDFVKLVAGGGIEKDAGTATLDNNYIGIFLGCQYTDDADGVFKTRQYWPASTSSQDAVALVADDPDLLFKIQADGAVAAADRGQNAGIVQTAGSTTIGRSKNALDQSTLATTSTLPLRVVDFVESGGSTAGDAFTDVICKVNGYHSLTRTTGI